MNSAEDLIRELSLQPLPGEGGLWAPIFNNGDASAIYFLMKRPDFSAWHKIPEQEMWIHVAGSPTLLYTFDRAEGLRKSRLDNSTSEIQSIVAPDRWMAAQPEGDWSLVICTLTPAFSAMELADRDEVESWLVDPAMLDEVRVLLHD